MLWSERPVFKSCWHRFIKQFLHFIPAEAKTPTLLSGGLDMLILKHIGYTYFNYFDGDVAHIRKLLEVNFLSYVTMTVSALPMLKESGGSILVVTSTAGE